MSATSKSSESHPVLLSLNLAPTDQGLRDFVRLNSQIYTVPVQRVICENSRYADATYAAWVNRKIAKLGHCGGGYMERYVPRIVDETFEDAHRRYVRGFVKLVEEYEHGR